MPSSLAFPALSGNLFAFRDLSCGVLPKAFGERVALGIARGLSHIHEHGFMHRDLKPANILMHIGDAGVVNPRIADFGWSRGWTEKAEGASLRATPNAMTPWWRPLEIELRLDDQPFLQQ